MGKSLKFFANLFELYLRSYRIYYLVQESEKIVLVLAIEHKDEQKKYLRKIDIEEIKHLLGENP